MVGSLTEREKFYGSLKTCKITCEDLYGKPLECDLGGGGNFLVSIKIPS